MKTPSSTSQPFKVTSFLAGDGRPTWDAAHTSCPEEEVPAGIAAATDSRLCSGLAVMADGYPERILQRLLQEFQPASSTRAPSLEIRLKMGEVLMRASRAMGTTTSELHLSL